MTCFNILLLLQNLINYQHVFNQNTHVLWKALLRGENIAALSNINNYCQADAGDRYEILYNISLVSRRSQDVSREHPSSSTMQFAPSVSEHTYTPP